MPPELGHNRSISERNDFFKMAVGGQDNPLIPEHVMNEALEDLNAFELLEEDEDDLTVDTDDDLTLVSDTGAPMYFTSPVISPRSVMELETRFRYESEDEPQETTPDYEQIYRITHNAIIAMTRSMQASLRFMRVDVHKLEREHGISGTTASMRIRIEHMEQTMEAFEDQDLFTLYRLTPRSLFED